MILKNKDTLLDVVNNIMTDMFFIFPDIDDEGQPIQKSDASGPFTDVTIHFNTDSELYFRIENDILSEMAANFMGLSPEEIEQGNLESMALETANIIGGNFLVEIDPEQKYSLSIPQIADSSEVLGSDDRAWTISLVSEDSAMMIWPQKRS